MGINTSIGDVLRDAGKRLDDQLDAEILLSYALQCNRASLYAWPQRQVPNNTIRAFDALVQRRMAGEPIAYLTGEKEFWSLSLTVTPDTLIPRPETELIVELALKAIPADVDYHIADLGTGSGAIALAIAKERPRCRITAIDRSSPALDVARANAQRLGLKNIVFLKSDWFAQLSKAKFNVLVSNPPYIATNNSYLKKDGLPFEPQEALISRENGMADLQHIAKHAVSYLVTGGLLIVEHGYDQSSTLLAMLRRFDYSDVIDHRDISGINRAATARSASSP